MPLIAICSVLTEYTRNCEACGRSILEGFYARNYDNNFVNKALGGFWEDSHGSCKRAPQNGVEKRSDSMLSSFYH